MKRNSITAIIDKTIVMTRRLKLFRNLSKEIYFAIKIRRAAVNEIIRLQAKEEYADQVERLQQRCEEIDMMTQIVNDQESSPASVLGDEMPGTPDYMNDICGSFKPKTL